jgi:hypothetical protein
VGGNPSVAAQYLDQPDSYPVSKAGMDYSHIWRPGQPGALGIFDTKKAFIEIGMYQLGGHYTGDEVVKKLTEFEKAGFQPYGVFLYREEWLKGGHAGVFPEDQRLLSPTEIAAIRHAIAVSDLKNKDVKLVQLLGARDSKDFYEMSDAVQDFLLKNFDGVGTECHVNMENLPDQRSRLVSMAAIAKWTRDHGKIGFVFVGGLPPTYEHLTQAEHTYEYIWQLMAKAGVPKNSPNLIYFRQAARPGKEVPESEPSLTQQQAWLIKQVK